MCKEEGKGFDFFRKFFFHYWMAKEGGQGYIYIYVEGGWEGEGVDFIYKFIMGVLVGSIHFQK